MVKSRLAPASGTKKLYNKVAGELGREIATGKFAVGSLLPTETEGSERFGVSRTTYREGIMALASKGLVTTRAKTGTRINPHRQWAMLDPEVIAWMFSSKPTSQSVRSLFELRVIIEPAAAALAAERRTADQLLEIGRAYEDMAAHGFGSMEWQTADGRFHKMILEATGNDFLVSLTESIETAVRWTTFLKASASRTPRDPVPLHLDVYRAIADRNPDQARSAVIVLLEIAREDTEALLV